VPRLPAFEAGRTVVVLMGLGHLPELVAGALAGGWPPELPAAVVSRASLPGERWVAAPLARLPAEAAGAALEAPATLVLGAVAGRAVAAAARRAEEEAAAAAALDAGEPGRARAAV
jgi:siroheme synthase